MTSFWLLGKGSVILLILIDALVMGGGDVNGLQNLQLYIHIFWKKRIIKACSLTRRF